MNEPPAPPPPDDDPELEPEPRFVLAAGVVVYGLMGAAALVWLWLRDRLDALPERAVGTHGPLAASGLGLGVGLGAAWIVARLVARHRGLQELSSTAGRLFARTGEAVGIAFVLVAAVAEELFFRLAVQDAFGLVGSVAAYAILNSSVGGLRWLAFTLAHALVLGLMVQQGFGLLGSTTAHAVLNYLSLRRIQER